MLTNETMSSLNEKAFSFHNLSYLSKADPRDIVFMGCR